MFRCDRLSGQIFRLQEAVIGKRGARAVARIQVERGCGPFLSLHGILDVKNYHGVRPTLRPSRVTGERTNGWKVNE
ncbi:MAG: hypothetical protein ABI273_10225 [Lacunisphaera sp.]